MNRYRQHVPGICAAIGGLVVLVLGSVTAGQVDTRVQTGNVLDANPQVGTGGANTPVRGYQPLNSQLYVNGQVTGLAGFRGNVPYTAPGELSLTLPGESVRSFRQRSVGLSQVMSGGTYQPQAYLDRAQAALNVRGVTSGINVPGSNVPIRSTLSTKVAYELFGQATQPYTRIITPPTRVVSTAMRAIGPVDMAPKWLTTESTMRVDQRDRPGDSATFQLPSMEDRLQLIRELRELDREEEAESNSLYKPLDARVDTAINTQAFQPVEGSDSSDEQSDQLRRDDLPEPGDDIFHDVLMALRQQHIRAARADRDRAEDGPGLTEEKGFVSEALIMIRTLGGENEDHFNDFMRAGDGLMAEGRFYDAARQYRSATIANPNNPLGHVGAALSMFAAGETYSAARHLQIAMRLFPPLMETRLDIAAMMDYSLFEQRLRQFKELVREREGVPEDPAPLLLATYFHSCIGEDADARLYAFRLRAAGRGNQLYEAYARFVLTGKLPDEPDEPDDGKPAGQVISPEGPVTE